MRTYDLKKMPGLPLYESLYRSIRADILSGKLAAEEKLPSKRALSRNLEVGKTTVEAAYAQLLDEGYIYSREKVGYFVAGVLRPVQNVPLPVSAPAAPARPLIDLTANGTGHFPFTVWNRLQREVILDLDKELLSPMEQQGAAPLRRAIAAHLSDFRGMQVEPDCILVGAGTDFLYNILVQLLGREHTFAVEEPGYPKIRSVYEAAGARCISARLDEQGAIPDTCGEASVLHISPSHNYPTGTVMSMSRRKQWLSWAVQGDRFIIEDDFDSEFRYSVHPKPALQSMDPEHVIYMNSFSKSLAPSIRIGYLVLPQRLARNFREHFGFYSCTVPSFEQYTLARFLDQGCFEKHINRMRKFYNGLRKSLMERMDGFEKITVEEQDAGLHFLLKLDTTLSDRALEEALKERGIRARTLSSYYQQPAEALPHRLVVNYSGLCPEDYDKVLQTLNKLM